MSMSFTSRNGEMNLQSQRRQAEVFVIDSAYWSVWSGLVPIPLVDALYTSSIQLKMINEICAVYDVPFSRNRVKALLAALAAGGANGLLAMYALRVLQGIPGLGSVTIVVTAAVTTYLIGQMFIGHFENGGGLEDFDVKSAKQFYQRHVRQAAHSFAPVAAAAGR